MTTARLPAQTCLLAGRNLRRLPRSPDQIAGILAQAVRFTLLFNYVFGPAIHVPGGGSYTQYRCRASWSRSWPSHPSQAQGGAINAKATPRLPPPAAHINDLSGRNS